MKKPHLKMVNSLWCLWESRSHIKNGELPVIINARTAKLAYNAYIGMLNISDLLKPPVMVINND